MPFGLQNAPGYFQVFIEYGICSRSLTPAEKNYDTYDKEMLAITYALEKWFHILEGTPGRNRQILFLSQFWITWKYIEGPSNPADAPSRRLDYKTEGNKICFGQVATPAHNDFRDTLDSIAVTPVCLGRRIRPWWDLCIELVCSNFLLLDSFTVP